MIVGDPAKFAIESEITKAYERHRLMALGYFVVHLKGFRFGLSDPDATMLADAFYAMQERVARRGSYLAPLAGEPSAGAIADAVIQAIYADVPLTTMLLGWTEADIRRAINGNRIDWGPYLDEAFDDRSHLLQFDVEERVRLIGYRHGEHYRHDPATLREIWLPADEFYRILQTWYERLEAEWASLPTTDG